MCRQTRDIGSMLVKCWATVADGGPAFNKHRMNAPCLLGCDMTTRHWFCNALSPL